MSEIELKYGRGSIRLAFDGGRFDVLGEFGENAPLSDIEIEGKLDRPIDSRPLEELISSTDTVLLVVPDATRRAATGQIGNLLVRRLIAAGIAPFNLSIIFATGIHRKVTDQEKREI